MRDSAADLSELDLSELTDPELVQVTQDTLDRIEKDRAGVPVQVSVILAGIKKGRRRSSPGWSSRSRRRRNPFRIQLGESTPLREPFPGSCDELTRPARRLHGRWRDVDRRRRRLRSRMGKVDPPRKRFRIQWGG